MKTNSELRAAGRADLSGKWNNAALLMLVVLVISGSVSVFPGIGTFAALLLIPMGWSVYMTFLSNHRGEQDSFDISHIFDGYRDGQFARIFTTQLLVGIFTVLWTMLFIVPGIIKGISYAMTPFILKDHPELKNRAAIDLSQSMMQGHKWDFFCLQLSFIGWILLSFLTLGIGIFWVAPYMYASEVNFYEELKNEGNCCVE